MKTLKKIVAVVISAVIIMLSLEGCSKPTSSTSAKTSKEITLCESWNFDGGFFPLQSPHVTNGTYGLLHYLNSFYETLVNYKDGEIVPGLAEKWDISDDGLVYTFHLKKDINFSDGTPFNAEAVKVNLDNIPKVLGDFNGSWGLTSTLFDKITVVDEYTVEVRLKTPYYGTLQDFTISMPMAMMSPKGYNADGTLSEITKEATLGTGPYMYNGEKENDTYTFVRNPHYNRGKSDVDVFHVKVIPDNDAKLLALRSGEIDMIVGSANISYDSFNSLSTDKKYVAKSSETTIQTRTMGLNVAKPLFRDKAVRLAVNHAIDKKGICNSIFFNIEQPADCVLDKNLPYSDVKTSPYEYNKEKAIKMLEDAGWIDADGDGVREKDNVKLQGTLLYSSDFAMLEDVALTIEANLKDIGFNINTLGKETMAYFQDISNDKFDLAIQITNAIPADPYLLISRLLTEPVRDNYLAQGLAGVKGTNDLINGLNSMTDKKEIQSTFDVLINELHNNASMIPLSRVKGMAAFSKSIISDYTFSSQPDYIDVSLIKLK